MEALQTNQVVTARGGGIRMFFIAAAFGAVFPRYALIRRATAEEPASDALLDEVAAGADANIALIQRGVAKYRTSKKRFLRNSPAEADGRGGLEPEEDALIGPYTSETLVYFDYPRVRLDWRGQRATTERQIIEESESIIYDGDIRIKSQAAFVSPYARIDPLRGGTDAWSGVHPRQQANPNWPNFLGTAVLAAVRSNPKATVSAARQNGGIVKVTMDGPAGRLAHWVSTTQGYCIVLAKYWTAGADESQEPYQIHEGTFRKASNGAFVLDHRVSHTWLDVQGVLRPNHDEELTLLELEMRDELDPNTFALAGLNLPKGAKIIDKVHGKEYAYEVPNVREQEIAPPQPSGAIASRPWLLVAYAAVGVMLVAALVWKLRPSRR